MNYKRSRKPKQHLPPAWPLPRPERGQGTAVMPVRQTKERRIESLLEQVEALPEGTKAVLDEVADGLRI